MLVSLSIRNIALIEKLHIEFNKGMNVLSGETGAGKSIIIDSINLMLGERADRGLIRSGCEKASVEGIINISDSPKTKKLLEEMQIEADDDLISIYRQITATGRNTCRVCGVIVPLTALKALTEVLIDIHGQHQHQSLMDSKKHMEFLDSFGGETLDNQKQIVAAAYHLWKESSSHYASLRKENARKNERLEYLTSRVKELDDASIEMGEGDKLLAEKNRFASAEKINRSLNNAYGQVLGGGKQLPMVDKLKSAISSMGVIDTIDPQYKALEDRLSALYYEAEEIGFELRALIEAESFDPERFEQIQQRLDTIRRLEKKYGMTSDELCKYHEEIKTELSQLTGMDERLRYAEADFKEKLKEYRNCARGLTAIRKQAATVLEKEMEKQLSELGMSNTRFACVFEEPEDPRKVVPTANGDDVVVFYIAPNPGEPLKPLDQTASGGELSRLMLAFKTTAAEKDAIPCMIFDEIDTGISGRTAQVVAEKMASIAMYHQVLCITHLAQIAAMADTEFLVYKEVVQDRTYTTVLPLEGERRTEEIARLIGVVHTEQLSGMAHAREILSAAEKWKKEHVKAE